jgi:hypothetical protein
MRTIDVPSPTFANVPRNGRLTMVHTTFPKDKKSQAEVHKLGADLYAAYDTRGRRLGNTSSWPDAYRASYSGCLLVGFFPDDTRVPEPLMVALVSLALRNGVQPLTTAAALNSQMVRLADGVDLWVIWDPKAGVWTTSFKTPESAAHYDGERKPYPNLSGLQYAYGALKPTTNVQWLDPPAEVPPSPPVDAPSLYRGATRFDREQLTFVVQTILIGALDRIESMLPTNVGEKEADVRLDDLLLELNALTDCALSTAGMSLGVLYAQLTNDGLGVDDALTAAGEFREVCTRLCRESWADAGEAVYAAMRQKKTYQIKDVLPHFHETRISV